MIKRISLNQASAVVALAVLVATASYAQQPNPVPLGSAPLPGQVGIIAPTGSQVTGGDVGYGFALTANQAGPLTVTASIKLGKWKPKFPTFNSTPSNGVTLINGPLIAVPTNVVGDAVMKVKVKFNKKTIANRKIPVTIGPVPTGPATPTTVSLLDVGFENVVILDGTKVPVSGLGADLTYAWTQLNGPTGSKAPGVLSSATVVSPTLTTAALTEFVDMSEKFGGIDGIGLDTEQVDESTYKYQLVVSGNSQMRTGVYTVVCSSASPKQPNVPVGLLAYFKAETNSTDWVLLSKPAGSSATLTHTDSLTPALRPDVEGAYIIKDNVSGATRTNTAASWTGVQFCAICHGPGNNVGLTDMVTPWSQTGHASFFKEMINGEHGSYYKEDCIKCHTVGYNKAPTANNGGFDDVATALGWTFPSTIKSNNWDSVPLEAQGKANIQCESCHGPGSQHPGPTSVSLNVAVCAQCHQDGHYHTRVEQWERSPHFKGFKEVSEVEGENATCARCHAPDGFVDVAKRVANGQDIVTASATNNYATGTGELICQGCHDPHHTFDNPDRHQLRIYDTVVLGNPAAAGYMVLTNQGASATCMYCHNTRRFPYQLSSGKPNYTSVRSGQISGPHESTSAEIFKGIDQSVITYGASLGDTFHTDGAQCVDCHMYPNPAIGAAGHNQVGDHTFNMTYTVGSNTVDNVAACALCHTGAFAVDKFDVALYQKDYDGTNGVQGIQSETTGLLDAVRILLNTSGCASVTNAAGEYTGFASPGTWTATNVVRDAQYKAAWNWMMVNRDHSKGVHNPRFTVRLLQNTYTDLSTNYYGNPALTFTNVFPNAVLYQ